MEYGKRRHWAISYSAVRAGFAPLMPVAHKFDRTLLRRASARVWSPVPSGCDRKIWRSMSHEDLVLATLYTKNGPVSVEQEICKDVDRLMAARVSNQLTEKELAQANIDTARRLMATSDPRLREIGRLVIDCGQF